MKLKVAHITLSMGTGGIEHCICHLAKALDRRSFEMSIGCLDYTGALFETIGQLGIDTFVEHRKPGLDWRLILRLTAFFKAKQYHIVHTHNQASHFYGGIAAKLSGIPILITTEHSRHYIDSSRRRVLEKKFLYQLTDKWVTVSNELYQQCIQTDNLKSGKLCMINNGVPVDDNYFSWEPKENLNIKKVELGLPADSKIIIMVARLHPIKNHALLLESFAIEKNQLTDTHVLLAGSGKELDALKKLSQKLEIENRVHFLGDRQDISQLLKISNLFVLCSHSEGLPLSLLEACAARLPVLITDSANKAGFIEHQENGIVVDSNKLTLSKALVSMLAESDKLKKLTEVGFQKVSSRFSLTAMARSYERLYLSLARKKKIISG